MAKLCKLSWADWWILWKTAAVMTTVRLTLGLLPFAVVHRVFTGVGVKVGPRAALKESAVQQAVWAVKVIGRRLPKATCLVQAYTLHYLLLHQGVTTELRIGVIRGPGRQLEAHAWVERCGQILIGDLPNLKDYTTLPALERLPA